MELQQILLNATNATLLADAEQKIIETYNQFDPNNYVLINSEVDYIIIHLDSFQKIFNSVVEFNGNYFYYCKKLNKRIQEINVNAKLLQRYSKNLTSKPYISIENNEIESLIPFVHDVVLASDIEIPDELKENENIKETINSKFGLCLLIDKQHNIGNIYCYLIPFMNLFKIIFVANGKIYFFNKTHKHVICVDINSKIIVNFFSDCIDKFNRLIEFTKHKDNLTIEQQNKYCVIDKDMNILDVCDTFQECAKLCNTLEDCHMIHPIGTTKFGEQFVDDLIIV
jgi:hypothetical protein